MGEDTAVPARQQPSAVENREQWEEAVIDHIIAHNEIMVPQEKIQEEAAAMLLEYRHRLRYESMASGISYDALRETEEELQQRFWKEAVRELKRQQIIQTVIREENLEVSPEELEREAEALAERQNLSLDIVKSFLGEGCGMLRRDLLEKKAMNVLYQIREKYAVNRKDPDPAPEPAGES